MSAGPQGWVYKHSPYRGSTFCVHLALGDIANDVHNYAIFCGMSELAKKARVSRSTVHSALASMVQDGFLEVLTEPTDNEPGTYELLMPEGLPLIYETKRERNKRLTAERRTQNGCTESGQAVQPARVAVQSEEFTPLTIVTQKTQEEETKDPLIENLCLLLADLVQSHRGSRPKISGRWYGDMAALIRLGPLGVEKPDEWDLAVVERGMKQVFTELVYSANGNFCWADQVRSPSSLRRHWDELMLAMRPKAGQLMDDGYGNMVRVARDEYGY